MDDIVFSDSDSESSLPNSELSRFASLPTNVSGLIALASDLDIKASAFEKRITALTIDLGNKSEKAKAEIERVEGLSQNQKISAIQKRATALRREAAKATEEERYEHLKVLKRGEEQITIVEAQFASPAHLLAREGLGTPERSRYQSQIASSGPLELKNFAAYAVASSDKKLGAALMARLDSMKPADRKLVGVSRQSLAEALSGEDHRKAKNAVQIVKNRFRQAMMSNREFETGKATATGKIGMAMAKSRETGPLDD